MSEAQMVTMVIRTSDDDKPYIWSELQAGRLRQGWGVAGSELIDQTQQRVPVDRWIERWIAAVRRVWSEEVSPDDAAGKYRILTRLLELQREHLVVVPKMPDWDHFAIARVKSPYRFDFEGETLNGDFKHVIGVDSVKPIPKNCSLDASFVQGRLKAYQSPVNRVWVPEFIEAVGRLWRQQQVPLVSLPAVMLLREKKAEIVSKFALDVVSKFQPKQIEELVREVFENAGFEFERSNHFDGAGGDADLIFRHGVPLLGEVLVFVQVKHKSGVDHDGIVGVRQLIKIAEGQPGSLKVLITTADDIGEEARVLAQENGVVMVVGRDAVEMLMTGLPLAR